MKKYAIYGDDDQQRLNEIFNEEEEIQALVDLANKKVMTERKKNASSKKKIIDTTVNNERPGKVDDVAEGKVIEPKRKLKDKKKEEPKEKKKKSKTFVIVMMIILLTVVILSTIFTLFDRQIIALYNSYFGENPQSSENVNTDDVQPITSINSIIQGSKATNEGIQNYYSEIQKIYDNSKQIDVRPAISDLKNRVLEDYGTFLSTRPEFIRYEKGENFFNSLQSRYDNLKVLVEKMESSDLNNLFPVIKEGIDIENRLVAEGKILLINFFEANNIEFTEEGTKIVFNVN